MNSETPETTIQQRAQQRFDRIRAGAIKSIGDGALANAIDDGRFVLPTGLCVSCIARVRSNAPEILPALGELLGAVAETGDCYLYPADSFHVSLLALTQREQVATFETNRIDRLMGVAQPVLSDTPASAVQLGAINLLGNQWFLEVVPVDDTWAVARRRIADASRSVGEEPIAFPDTEPIHLNLGRINAGLHSERALAVLAQPQTGLRMTLSSVDIVVTDFVVSDSATVDVASIDLQHPDS